MTSNRNRIRAGPQKWWDVTSWQRILDRGGLLLFSFNFSSGRPQTYKRAENRTEIDLLRSPFPTSSSSLFYTNSSALFLGMRLFMWGWGCGSGRNGWVINWDYFGEARLLRKSGLLRYLNTRLPLLLKILWRLQTHKSGTFLFFLLNLKIRKYHMWYVSRYSFLKIDSKWVSVLTTLPSLSWKMFT